MNSMVSPYSIAMYGIVPQFFYLLINGCNGDECKQISDDNIRLDKLSFFKVVSLLTKRLKLG